VIALSKHQLAALHAIATEPKRAEAIATELGLGFHVTHTMLQTLRMRGLVSVAGMPQRRQSPRGYTYSLNAAGRAAIAPETAGAS
jgi:hypothetical protein